VTSPLAQALYLIRQHYRRTIPSGVDNNRIIYTDEFVNLCSINMYTIGTGKILIGRRQTRMFVKLLGRGHIYICHMPV
jgi:hypothetical protein